MAALPIVVPVVLLALAGLAMSKKKRSESPPPDASEAGNATDAQAREMVATVMAPGFTDVGQMQVAAAWLAANGYPEDAAKVWGKVAATQAAAAAAAASEAATAAAQEEADEAREQARIEWEKAAGGRPTQDQIDQIYRVALTNTDPGQVEYAWSILEAYGDPRADELKRRAESLRAQGRGGTVIAKDADPAPTAGGGTATAPEPETVPDEPPEVDTDEVAETEDSPEADPYGTIALAKAMIAEEGTSRWKYISEDVRAWQSRTGLQQDGKFGPGSALRMATEVGTLPKVRYWPLGSTSKSQAVGDYQAKLLAYAASIQDESPGHALALRLSAANENGQGWPSTPAPVPASQQVDGAALARAIAGNLAEATVMVASAVTNAVPSWVLEKADREV